MTFLRDMDQAKRAAERDPRVSYIEDDGHSVWKVYTDGTREYLGASQSRGHQSVPPKR